MFKYALVFFSALCFCSALTPVAGWLAVRAGAVDLPGGRRIHRQPTARFGGVAIFVSMILGVLLAASIDSFIAGALLPGTRQSIVLIVGASAIMVIGMVDDLYGLAPALKLVLEIAIAAAIAGCGYCIESIGGIRLGWLELPVTVAWLVAVTNAFNMIDGLDGLAAGVGAMVTATLFLLSLYLGNVPAALMMALLGGALIGFLPYNFHPARIFLGDSGSLFVGFVLALTSVVTSNKLATFVAVLVPVLALGLPIAELTLTMLRRFLRVLMVHHSPEGERYRIKKLGRAGLFTGDRDHIHHRLLSLGITHKNAVLILYGGCLALCTGAFGLAVLRAPGQAFLISAVGVVSIIGISRLGYRELRPLRNGLLLPVFDSVIFTRRLVQALLDLSFIVLAFVGAYLIDHRETWTSGTRDALRNFVPLVAIVQIGCFGATHLYRRAYRYQGIADLLAILKAIAVAVFLSTGASVIAGHLWAVHYPGLTVIVLDAYLLATMVLGARLSFRMLDHLFRSEHPRGSRMLICGTGNSGTLAFNEIRSNPSLNMTVVGFLEDDPGRWRRTWQGVPIYGARDLDGLIAERKFDGLILSNGNLDESQPQEVIERCVVAGLPVRRFQIDFSEIRNEIAEPGNGNGDLPERIRRPSAVVNDV